MGSGLAVLAVLVLLASACGGPADTRPAPGSLVGGGQAPASVAPSPAGATDAAAASFPPTPQVLYDPTDPGIPAAYPDDFWAVDAAASPTGVRLALREPDAAEPGAVLFSALARGAEGLDGWSALAPLVIPLSSAPRPGSLPVDPDASLEAGASAGLFDLGAPGGPQRVPFRAEIRRDAGPLGSPRVTLLVFPSIPLRLGGEHVFVISRGVASESGEPFTPSPFFADVVSGVAEGPAARRLGARLVPALAALEPEFAASELALALAFTVASQSDFARDPLAIRARIAAEPPSLLVTRIEPSSDPEAAVAALVHGVFQAPEFREQGALVRGEDGAPEPVGDVAIPFVLALPRTGPAPLVLYQHGNPGSAEHEVPLRAEQELAEAGFAVIGFTDVFNRELSGGAQEPFHAIQIQLLGIYLHLLASGAAPAHWTQTLAEQLAFVHALPGLDGLDVLPVGAPDGRPDLALDAPLGYLGISQGANLAPALLPYLPEVRAAALVAAGARLTELLLYQEAGGLMRAASEMHPGIEPSAVYAAVALFQGLLDPQDAHNHARFLYREPSPVLAQAGPASVLLIEGAGDSLVPNHATESLAWALGPIPLLAGGAGDEGVLALLEGMPGPIAGNHTRTTSTALARYVPRGSRGATPGCTLLSPASGAEGHFCAQSAAEAIRQRRIFLETALSEAAPIIAYPATE